MRGRTQLIVKTENQPIESFDILMSTLSAKKYNAHKKSSNSMNCWVVSRCLLIKKTNVHNKQILKGSNIAKEANMVSRVQST